jgi:ABC-type methionine transport system ATPase subunit
LVPFWIIKNIITAKKISKIDLLIAEQISKKYDHALILNKVSLTLNKGEVSVLLGPSGCGKTTLLRCLCLLDLPNSGNLQIDTDKLEFPQTKKTLPKIYPKINIVFQQLFLWNHLSNRENIAFPMRENGFDKNEIEQIISDLVDELNLSEFIDKLPHQSSVGQKQRIAIARTLALKPKYLLLDEITSALDVVQTNSIVRKIKSLSEKKDIAILLVTHNLDVAKRVADKILFMDKGEIVENGVKAILKNPQTESFQNFLK